MKRFLLLYKGPPTPPDASHEGWPVRDHPLWRSGDEYVIEMFEVPRR
jgi:hypothetical protein